MSDVLNRFFYKPKEETKETKAEKIEKMEEKAKILLQGIEETEKALFEIKQYLHDYVRPMLLDIAETQYMDYEEEKKISAEKNVAPSLYSNRPMYWDYFGNGVAPDAEERYSRYKRLIDGQTEEATEDTNN